MNVPGMPVKIHFAGIPGTLATHTLSQCAPSLARLSGSHGIFTVRFPIAALP
jgi:hypothetical protein